MQAFLKAFATYERNEQVTYERVDYLHPFECTSNELEAYMYNLASGLEDKRCDWITVVAYELDGTPFLAIDFGRRYATYTANEFGPVWDPSRDYWTGDEISPELWS